MFAGALVVFGAGMGLAGPPATEAIIESLPLEKQGVASAVNDVSRELGGALGIAIIGSAFNTAYRSSIDDSTAALKQLPQQVVDAVRDSPAAGAGIAKEMGRVAQPVIEIARRSFIEGFGVAMWVCAAAVALGALYVVIRAPRRDAQSTSPASMID